MNYFRLSIVFVLAACTQLFAAQYTVSSVDDFHALTLSPGDEVIWANGNYSDDESIRFEANGTAASPITLRAETPGGVIFNGGMTMLIGGDYVIVDGFYWSGGAGQNNHIQFRRGEVYANYSTIRNCAINDLTASGTDKHRWIVLYGTNNTVENCSFVNKRSPGALVLVELEYNDASSPVGHQIRNNYFFNYEYRDPDTTHSGDSETIRIGESENQAKSASVLVENNYFQACDGENEIITNKSANNTYLHNTFRNCHGSLVLRHGANAWVEGNFFLGENKVSSGGIRVSDSFHTIINNYFQGLNNDEDIWNNAITLVGGSDPTGGTNNGYQKVDGILVAYNTIYNCDDPLFYNDRSSYDPRGVFAYNLLHSTSTDIVGGDISGTGQGMTYAGNMVNGSPIGISDSGFSIVSPDFGLDGEIYKPSSSSLVSGAGGSNYSSEVNFDLEGRTRPESNMDVGAHEVSGGRGNATYAPHTNDDVRGLVGASFLDAAGVFVGNSGVGFLTVSSVSEFSHLAGNATISVSSNAAWSAVDDAAWISISPSSGNGNGAVSVSVSENTSSSARTGSVTFSTSTLTRTVTVDQRGFVEPVFVASVTLSPATVTISEGGSVQLTAEVAPVDAIDQSVVYSSSDPAVATVNSEGGVAGVSAGTAIITVTTNDGSFSDTSEITVNEISSFTNLALNKPVTGYEPQAANSLSNLTDGDATNRWSADNYPQPATIDLGAVYSLERSELVTYNDRAYQYTIEVATELAGPYTEVVDRTENTTVGLEDSPIEDLLNSVVGRFVRITVTGANIYTGPWTSLSEFRVFGEAVPSIPGYQQWLSDHPALAQVAPGQDSDGDGIANILEYIFQRDPFSVDQDLGILGEKTGQGYQLSFNRFSESAQDTIQTLQYSSDLKNWESIDFTNDASAEVSIETNGATDIVTIVIPDTEISNEKLFWIVSAEVGL